MRSSSKLIRALPLVVITLLIWSWLSPLSTPTPQSIAKRSPALNTKLTKPDDSLVVDVIKESRPADVVKRPTVEKTQTNYKLSLTSTHAGHVQYSLDGPVRATEVGDNEAVQLDLPSGRYKVTARAYYGTSFREEHRELLPQTVVRRFTFRLQTQHGLRSQRPGHC